MDGLILHIKKAVAEGQFLALNMGSDNDISHSFFVDDVLIMGMLNHFSWLTLFHKFTKFANATTLYMNLHKSIIYHGICDMEIVAYIKSLFGVEVDQMMNGMKYLGYHIKPCGYKVADWSWLADCFFKRISGWEFICLSLGGHIILPQPVLMQLGVYWAHLYHLHISIMKILDRIMANFIWFVSRVNKKFHLVKMSQITLPKHMGGWGIMNLQHFGWALFLKGGSLEYVPGGRS